MDYKLIEPRAEKPFAVVSIFTPNNQQVGDVILYDGRHWKVLFVVFPAYDIKIDEKGNPKYMNINGDVQHGLKQDPFGWLLPILTVTEIPIF